MSIYIGCIKAGLNGGRPDCAEKWKSKYEFYLYCNELLSFRDSSVNRSMNIEQLCEAIGDIGFGGIGSRWYKRLSRAEALPVLN